MYVKNLMSNNTMFEITDTSFLYLINNTVTQIDFHCKAGKYLRKTWKNRNYWILFRQDNVDNRSYGAMALKINLMKTDDINNYESEVTYTPVFLNNWNLCLTTQNNYFICIRQINFIKLIKLKMIILDPACIYIYIYIPGAVSL